MSLLLPSAPAARRSRRKPVVVTRRVPAEQSPAELCRLVGTVNAAPVRLRNKTWPAETLLLAGIDGRLEGDGWRMTFRFLPRRAYGLCLLSDGRVGDCWAGWNRVFNHARGYWCRVVWAADQTASLYAHDTAWHPRGFAALIDGAA